MAGDDLGTRVLAALDRYGALTRPVVERTIPSGGPRRYLYDLVLDYPRRGGKSLRAGLCLATTGAVGGRLTDAVATAASLELVHNAFLIHDDIQDESDSRRGLPTLHSGHGVPLAINAGDATAMLAMQPLMDNHRLVGSTTARRILDEFHHMTRQTIEGQAIELGWRHENVIDLEPADYLSMVLGKTSWYTTIYPIRVGAIIGTRGAVDPSRFDHFGSCLGGLFQITDDIQNLEPTETGYGKELYGDILEGKRTLPLIHLLHNTDRAHRAEVVEFLSLPRSERTFADAQAVHHCMVSAGSVDWSRAYARGLAEDARDAFDETFSCTVANEHRTFLAEILVFLVGRLY